MNIFEIITNLSNITVTGLKNLEAMIERLKNNGFKVIRIIKIN